MLMIKAFGSIYLKIICFADLCDWESVVGQVGIRE